MSDKTPWCQQIIGAALLLSVGLAFLLSGLMGNSFEVYPHSGGGVFIEPWQQIGIGIVIIGFTAWLIVSELVKKRRVGHDSARGRDD